MRLFCYSPKKLMRFSGINAIHFLGVLLTPIYHNSYSDNYLKFCVSVSYKNNIIIVMINRRKKKVNRTPIEVT